MSKLGVLALFSTITLSNLYGFEHGVQPISYDLNLDGINDIIKIVDNDALEYNKEMHIELSNPDGTFQAPLINSTIPIDGMNYWLDGITIAEISNKGPTISVHLFSKSGMGVQPSIIKFQYRHYQTESQADDEVKLIGADIRDLRWSLNEDGSDVTIFKQINFSRGKMNHSILKNNRFIQSVECDIKYYEYSHQENGRARYTEVEESNILDSYDFETANIESYFDAAKCQEIDEQIVERI